MDTFTVSFFGHREIENGFEVERCLEEIITDLIRSKEYVEFLVGRDGEFDLLASSGGQAAAGNTRTQFIHTARYSPRSTFTNDAG